MLLALTLCFVVAFSSGYAIQNNLWIKHKTPKMIGNLFIAVESPMGVYDLFSGNVITNIGENQTGYRVGCNNTGVQVRWISLGNATASASLTKLTTEATTMGATRTLATYVNFTYSGDFAFNITAVFHFTDTITLNCAGAHWSGTSDSDNNMYSCADFTETTFGNNWNATYRWMYVFDAN